MSTRGVVSAAFQAQHGWRVRTGALSPPRPASQRTVSRQCAHALHVVLIVEGCCVCCRSATSARWVPGLPRPPRGCPSPKRWACCSPPHPCHTAKVVHPLSPCSAARRAVRALHTPAVVLVSGSTRILLITSVITLCGLALLLAPIASPRRTDVLLVADGHRFGVFEQLPSLGGVERLPAVLAYVEAELNRLHQPRPHNRSRSPLAAAVSAEWRSERTRA